MLTMQVKLLIIKDLSLQKSWFKPFLSKKQDENRLETGELINLNAQHYQFQSFYQFAIGCFHPFKG